MDRHDIGVVQLGEDSGFAQIGFDILGMSDTFWVRYLDRHGAVKFIVASKIDPSEAALTQAADDSVAPDRRGINEGESSATLCRGWGSLIPRQALWLVHRPDPDDDRPLMTSGAIVASRAAMQ